MDARPTRHVNVHGRGPDLTATRTRLVTRHGTRAFTAPVMTRKETEEVSTVATFHVIFCSIVLHVNELQSQFIVKKWVNNDFSS